MAEIADCTALGYSQLEGSKNYKMIDYYVNPAIKGTHRIFPMQGRYAFHRYDMNENPEGLPKEFVDSVLREITPEFLATYPEPDRFLRKYAAFIGVSSENVLATNGSDMAIRYLLETFGEPGREVVTVSPSFEMYRVNCSILGLKHVAVPYESDLSIDIDKILRAINCGTRIVVLLNPNNPIGNTYTGSELKSILCRAGEVGAVVMIDEAYHYFYPNTFLKYALEYENVVVLRTFSKLFSLAACRLGVMISNPQIIHYVKNAKLSFDANSIALLFGERVLDHPELIRKLIAEEAEGKQYLLAELQHRGYECRDCMGNFVLMKPFHPAGEIAGRLEKEKRILVHSYSSPPLNGYLRISTGSKQAMEIFLDALFDIDG